MASYVDSQHDSTSGGGRIDFGGFTFAPNKGISEKKILVYAAVGLVIYLIVTRKRK